MLTGGTSHTNASLYDSINLTISFVNTTFLVINFLHIQMLFYQLTYR